MSAFRPATRQDYLDVCGEPPTMSVRAWAFDYEGEAVALAGVAPTPYGFVAFSQMKKKVPAKAILREALAFSGFLAERYAGKWIVAHCEGTERFLSRLGWAPTNVDGVMQWPV